jgi:hypothetical protein
MKPLRNAVEDYIALHRSLGFKLRDMASGLTEFAAFLERPTSRRHWPWSGRCSRLIISQAIGPGDWVSFARSLAICATDPRTEIPAVTD